VLGHRPEQERRDAGVVRRWGKLQGLGFDGLFA
jgi:hypothetical protein